MYIVTMVSIRTTIWFTNIINEDNYRLGYGEPSGKTSELSGNISKLEGSLSEKSKDFSDNLAGEKVLTFSPGSLHSKAVQGSLSSEA